MHAFVCAVHTHIHVCSKLHTQNSLDFAFMCSQCFQLRSRSNDVFMFQEHARLRMNPKHSADVEWERETETPRPNDRCRVNGIWCKHTNWNVQRRSIHIILMTQIHANARTISTHTHTHTLTWMVIYLKVNKNKRWRRGTLCETTILLKVTTQQRYDTLYLSYHENGKYVVEMKRERKKWFRVLCVSEIIKKERNTQHTQTHAKIYGKQNTHTQFLIHIHHALWHIAKEWNGMVRWNDKDRAQTNIFDMHTHTHTK